MNDPTQKLLNKMLEYLETTESFMAEQTPEFIMQLLHYKFLESVLGFIAWLGIAFLACYSIKRFITGLSEESINEGLCLFWACISLLVFSTALVVAVGSDVPDFIKIWLAPKLYLVEYVRGML